MDKVALRNWGLVRAVQQNGGKMTHDMAHMVAQGWKGVPPPPSPVLGAAKRIGGAANAFALRNANPLMKGVNFLSDHADDLVRAGQQIGGAFSHFANAGGQHALAVLGLG